MRNVPRPTSRAVGLIATWRHPTRDGDTDMRATRQGDRIHVAARAGRHWRTTHDVPADGRTIAKLLRQGGRR